MTFDAEKYEPYVPDEGEFTVQWDSTHTFPFYENEDGDALVGYGHLDPHFFARAVNEYDKLAGLDDDWDPYTELNVAHLWAIAYAPKGSGEHDYWFIEWGVDEGTESSFPVTIILR